MGGHAAVLVAFVAGSIGICAVILAYIAGAIASCLLLARSVFLFLAALLLTTGIIALCLSVCQGVLHDGLDVRGALRDEGWRRISVFVRKVMPIVLHYKLVEVRSRGKPEAKVKAACAPLHVRYAPQALKVCQDMQGFYIKLGQMCAGAGAGVMPEEYLDAFQVLLEDCPPVRFQIIQDIVERDLGPLWEIFETFDEWPLHTASIGQVHGARLDGGLDVVVKVQNPEAERNFRIDIECFLQVARLLFKEHVHELEEIKKSFATEFDYRQEAALQREAALHLQGLPGVVVPLPIDRAHGLSKKLANGSGSPHRSGLCSKSVLVMERLYGKSLARWGGEIAEQMAIEQGTTKEEVLGALRAMTPDQLEQQKPGELALWMYSAGLQASEAACSVASVAYGLSAPLRNGFQNIAFNSVAISAFDWIADSVSALPATPSLPSIDLYSLPETLFGVQGHLLFEVGFVNTDPHPGNIMFLDDGRLGLIDWGQVKRLSPEQRCQLARAVIAVADGDEILSASCMRAMGMRTAKDLDWTYSRQAYFFLASWADENVREIGGPLKVEEVLNKVDRIIDGVGDFWMPMRNQFFTRQALAMMGFPRVNSACLLRPAAVLCLQRMRQPVPRTVRRVAAPPPDLTRVLGQHDKRD